MQGVAFLIYHLHDIMLILLLLVISCCVGSLLRKCRALRHLERTATWTVWTLIFVFGISLGSNKSVVADFAHFGFSAVVMAFAGVAGSVLAAWAIRGFIDRRGDK